MTGDALERLRALLPGAQVATPATIATASDAKGAYVLLAHLDAAQELAIRGRAWPLGAGWHFYVGSARGPGGMRARLRRHFRPDKRPHWHIDRLTIAADAMLALTLEGGVECDIVATLAGSGWFGAILPGFGSSDCSRCSSHLLVSLG